MIITRGSGKSISQLVAVLSKMPREELIAMGLDVEHQDLYSAVMDYGKHKEGDADE